MGVVVEQSSQREFKGIWIPKEIWLNNELSLQEKVMLAEIDSFETKNGCFASNSYLGSVIQLSPSRVSSIISNLIRLEYINSRLIYRTHSKRVETRILTVNKRKIYNL